MSKSKADEVFTLWLSVPKTDAYFRWHRNIDKPNLTFWDMTDAELDEFRFQLQQYMQSQDALHKTD